MKLWLDDVRLPPDGWVWAKTAGEAIVLLADNVFDEVSLDHDLGPESAGTGYQVVCWLEERVMTDDAFTAPVVHVHTSNPSARTKMLLAVQKIDRVCLQRF